MPNRRHDVVRLSSIVVVCVLALAACNTATPTAIPTLAMPTAASAASPATSGSITASAEVVPQLFADLSFVVPGLVSEVNVAEGDEVQAGDLLAAQENLAQLRSVLESARLSLISAQQALDDLTASAPLEMADAQLALVNAQKRYDDAVKSLKQKDFHRCDDDTIELFYSRMKDAEEILNDLRDDNDDSTFHLQRIYDAQQNFNVAQANYLYCIRYTDEEIAESSAELAVAKAGLEHATARYELLAQQNGVDPGELTRLQAAVASAEANLSTTQLALDRAVLKAPFSGTVVSVPVTSGQAVVPGQTVMTIATLDQMQVETTDLSERDIQLIRTGQPVEISLVALGESFPGKVVKISQRASKLGGDVVYKVTIQFDGSPAGLLWGMSATVSFSP